MALVVLLTVVLEALPAHAFDVRVGTRTRLTARIEAEGTRIAIDGHLRDNLGQGVEGEVIQVEFEPGGQVGADAYYSRDARTDRTGRFYLSINLDPGTYATRLTYSGREHYYGRSAIEDSVTSQRGEVGLGLQVPRLLSRTSGPVRVRVAATNGATPAVGLDVRVAINGEETEVETGKEGTASIPLDPSTVSGSIVRIQASFAGSIAFEPAEAEALVRILDAPQLTVEASNVRARLDRGVRVQGSVVDGDAEIPEALVDVVLVQKNLEVGRYSTRTDEDGEYDLFVAEDRLQEGPMEVQARLSVGGQVLLERSTTVQVTRTGGGLLPWLLAALLTGSVFVLGGFVARDWWRVRSKRRKPSRGRQRQTLAAARAPSIVPVMDDGDDEAAAPAGPTSIRGVLWDRQKEMPIDDGQVELLLDNKGAGADPDELSAAAEPVTTGSNGAFAFRDLEPGRYVLRAKSKGYISVTYGFKVPHSGVLSRFRLPMTPVRVVVRDLYEDMVEEVVYEQSSWGRLTPRQVRQRLLASLEAITTGDFPGGREGYDAFKERLEQVLSASREGAPMDAQAVVDAVVEVLEEVYYSQRRHDEALAVVMERLVDQLHTHASEGLR